MALESTTKIQLITVKFISYIALYMLNILANPYISLTFGCFLPISASFLKYQEKARFLIEHKL